jgi:hypothetical protein
VGRDYARLHDLLIEARAEARSRHDTLATAIIENDLAWTLCKLGRHGEAATIYADLLEREGVESTIRIYARAGLGSVALGQGDPAAAIVHLERARRELDALDTADPAATAEFDWQLADALLRANGASERVRELAVGALHHYQSLNQAEEIQAIQHLLDKNTHQRKESARQE